MSAHAHRPPFLTSRTELRDLESLRLPHHGARAPPSFFRGPRDPGIRRQERESFRIAAGKRDHRRAHFAARLRARSPARSARTRIPRRGSRFPESSRASPAAAFPREDAPGPLSIRRRAPPTDPKWRRIHVPRACALPDRDRFPERRAPRNRDPRDAVPGSLHAPIGIPEPASRLAAERPARRRAAHHQDEDRRGRGMRRPIEDAPTYR